MPRIRFMLTAIIEIMREIMSIVLKLYVSDRLFLLKVLKIETIYFDSKAR